MVTGWASAEFAMSAHAAAPIRNVFILFMLSPY